MSKDLISIDQLSIKDINQIHSSADSFLNNPLKSNKELANKILINFFFENSTRTRLSFEIAARRLGADVVNIDISLSSLKKGEAIEDMAATINAMSPDFVAIRHNSSGAVELIKKYIDASVINAGDGTNEHPSQALLDSFIIKKNKGDLSKVKIAICGDILHSRVAHSNLKIFKKFGTKINLITPPTLITKEYISWAKEIYGAEVYCDISSGIKDVDVVMMLRIQQERMQGCYISSFGEYFKFFGLDHKKLAIANKGAIVLHPGPINRDIEISSQLAEDRSVSLILPQVEAGVSVRQSILCFLKNI